MRSTFLAFAAVSIATPCVLAASPNFTSPYTAVHAAKPKDVFVTFANRTSQERDVHAAGFVYHLRANSEMNLHLAAGTGIRVTSDVNSKIDQTLPEIASLDRATVILQ